MLGTDGYEWLGEVATSNRNGTQLFGNLRNPYDGTGEHLKGVAKANHIFKIITTRMKIHQSISKFTLRGSRSPAI